MVEVVVILRGIERVEVYYKVDQIKPHERRSNAMGITIIKVVTRIRTLTLHVQRLNLYIIMISPSHVQD